MDSVVTLINNTARPIAIVLDHPYFQKKKFGFQLKTELHVSESKDGTRRQKPIRRAIPGSITLLAYGTVKNLHLAIQGCSQVRTLEKQGRITVRTESVESPPKPASRRVRRSHVVEEPKTEQPTEETEEK